MLHAVFDIFWEGFRMVPAQGAVWKISVVSAGKI